MMEKMLGSKVSMMEKELKENEESQKKIEEFNRQLSNSSKPETDLKSFCSGICITLCVIIVSCISHACSFTGTVTICHSVISNFSG